MLLTGHIRAHDARCPAVGNTLMSAPISAIMISAARLPTPGMVSRRSRGAVRGHQVVDAFIEAHNRALQIFEVVQRQADDDRVVFGEATLQRGGQCRDLGAQPTPGQLGQLLGVTLTRDQGPQHRPTRHTQQVGDNRIKFDASVFEDFGDALPSLVWAWTSRLR